MLLIDSGNSRIKWKLVKNGTCLQQGIATHAAWEDLRQTFSLLPQPHKIIISNVAGGKAEQNLREACAIWPAPVEILTASDALCGVRNGYEQPAQLGSDRWAALVAAWHSERSACLVVNCGTATTIDMLSIRGEFTGGLILPGMEMMQHSLCEGTAGLKRAQGEYREFPLNTADAIVSGTIQATVGAIRRQFDMLGAPNARCLLSGGAAGLIAGHLDIPFEQIDDLVLRGLQIIGQETRI